MQVAISSSQVRKPWLLVNASTVVGVEFHAAKHCTTGLLLRYLTLLESVEAAPFRRLIAITARCRRSLLLSWCEIDHRPAMVMLLELCPVNFKFVPPIVIS